MGLSLHSRDGAPSARSRLLELPAEIRNQILKHVVTQPEPLDLWHPKSPFNIDVRVMYVCKQLRDEARGFLYRDNTLEVGIKSQGNISYLHFSNHQMMCEYRAEEAVKDITSLYLERFTRFQFRFADARILDSLRRVIGSIKHHFNDKHVSVILPPPKEPRNVQQATSAASVSLYPRINNPLSVFSLMRCASLSISSPVPSYDAGQDQKLVELVTSKKPVVDMSREYEDAQRSARNMVRMIVPDGTFQEYERLGDRIFELLAAMCKSANKSDQDAFLLEREQFQECYREIEDLQWRVV